MPRAWTIAAMESIGRACVALGVLWPGAFAHAQAMDPALERLGGGTGCVSGRPVCPDQAGFEHLASELASATALPAMGVAAALGADAFGFGVGFTITDIDETGEHWRLGARGDDDEGLVPARGEAPMAALVWSRFEARKGLPFGFELGIGLAQGLQTSFWTPSLSLKWALFEGFRDRYGPLPDLALRAGYARSVGSGQLSIQVATFDLGVSRPFVVARTWTLTPFLGSQLLLADVESAVIDLTPGSDAFGSCAPDATAPPGPGVTPTGEACSGGSGEDFASDIAFDSLEQVRLRAAGGAEASWAPWRVRLLVHYDVLEPSMPTASGGLRQLAIDVTLGAVL